MKAEISIRTLEDDDIQSIAADLAALGWHKPASQFERYLAEQENSERVVLVALSEGVFVGYVTVKWHSAYPPFREQGIPEIVDLNVPPPFRRRGIATLLMDEAERLISERSAVAGIGVGLHPGYGAAQRMYVLRGYVPDGRALSYVDRQVQEGEQVTLDDSLALHLTKGLAKQ